MTAIAEKRQTATIPDAGHTSGTPWRGWLFAAGLPTLLTWWHAWYYGQWIVDDAGLTFAYARSLATGAGPVLQPGADPVEGFSNPAWLTVLVVGRWLGLFDHGELFGQPDLIMFPKLVGLLCCFGMYTAMFAIAALVTRRPVLLTLAAASFTAAVPSFVIWTTSGLENGLLALVVMTIAAVIARAAVRDRLTATSTAVAVGALAALAALTRPDGVVYAAAYPLAVALIAHRDLRRALRASAISLAAFVVPFGAYLTWRLVTFGDYLPNTARAKEQGWPTVLDLSKPADLIGYLGWITAVAGVVVVTLAVRRRTRMRPVLVALLVPLALAVTAFTLLQFDWMAQHRFATPFWPLATTAITVAAADLLRDSSTRSRIAAGAVAVLAATLSLALFSSLADGFRRAPTVGVCNIALNTGYAINGYADMLKVADGSLLAVDGGGSSLTTRLRFVDLSGLADKRIAHYWEDDDMSGLRDHVFDTVRPTFIRLFSGWHGLARLGLADDPRFDRDFALLQPLGPGGGEWVRRDVIPDEPTLRTVQDWAVEKRQMIDGFYDGVVPVRWRCGDVLRPTPYSPGRPADSPLTR